MLRRHLVLGHRHEARQSRLRGQQVIRCLIGLMRGGVVANHKELAISVVEEPELHLMHVAVSDGRNPLEPRHERRLSRGQRFGELQAGLPQRNQMTRQVSAVYGRDVRGLKHGEFGQRVPVEEVPAMPRKTVERDKGALQTVHHRRRLEEAEVVRTHRREQLQPDVRRRGPQRHDLLRIFLHVIWGQPRGLVVHEARKELPVRARITQCLFARLRREGRDTTHKGETHGVRHKGRDQPKAHERQHREQQSPQGVERRGRARGAAPDTPRANYERQHRRRPHRLPRARRRSRCRALRQRRGLPLEQHPLRHPKTPQGAENGVRRQPGVVRQEDER